MTSDRPDRVVRQIARASRDATINQVARDQHIYNLHINVGVPPAVGFAPRVLLPSDEFWRGQTPPLPGHGQPLVGRDEHAAALREALGSVGAPAAPRIVVVEGPAGIGKTRLAVDVSEQVAPTLVARAGVAVSPSDMWAVPTDAAAIVVVDDARYGSRLSGLAAMIGDPLYAQVKIVFTLRAGIARQVLADVGLAQLNPVTVSLDILTNNEIDQVVTNHGITVDEFRLHVADIAAGNPFLAHTACELFQHQGTYSWRDSSDLLREFFERRLAQIPNMTRAHHATAVALAVMTRADGGEHLAQLADAITMLPPEADRLDCLLDDLVQAGIADESPYALRPDAIGPVVAAGALTGTGVKIKTSRVLNILGGIGPGTSACTLPENVNTTVFATQLSVLAQAAHQADDRACLGALHRALGDLVEGPTAMDTWLEVLVLAGQVAPFSPQLLGELRDALISQWPLTPGEPWWNEDPEQRYHFDVERLLRQATTVAEQAGPADADRAVRWILDVAWLAYPVLPRPSVEFAQRAVTSLVKARLPASAESWDAVFAHREEVFRAVLRWGRERRASPPVGLASEEQGTRDGVVAEELLFSALGPFLTVVTEDHLRGVPGNVDVMVWGHHVLPDDSRTTSMLAAATGAVDELIQRLDLSEPQSRRLLDPIARLPFRLRGEGARGLSGTTPLPDYVVQALGKAADAVGAALATRWAELPVMVRHTAAEYTVRPAERTASTLADLAAVGDPIATAAVADSALKQLLVLLPLSENLSFGAQDDAEADGVEQQRRRAAEQLGEQLSIEDSLALLDAIDFSSANAFGHNCLGWFATAAGRNTSDDDVDAALDRLAAGPLTADAALLTGLLQARPEPISEWLTTNLANLHIARLAIAVAADLPAEQEAGILDAITAMVTSDRIPDTADATAQPQDGAEPGVDALTNAEADLSYLACQLAWGLARGRQPQREHLARLVTVGVGGPTAALPRVLGSIGYILGRTPAGDRPTNDDRVLRQGLVAVLGRALAESDRAPYAPVDYDIAIAATALAAAAPDELAELLMQRILDGVDPVLPSECQELLASADVEQCGPAAVAFQVGLDQQREAGALTDRMEAVALRVLSQLGAGSDDWIEIIQRLAAGTAVDRARAARLIKDSWHHPAWAKIVPDLIHAGLDERSLAVLRRGLAPDGIGVDLDSQLGRRTEVLQRLLDDPRSTVRSFAIEAMRQLDTFRDY